MEEIIYKPKDRLSQIVKFFWYCDGYKPSARAERVLPSGSSQIIINLEEKCFRHFQTSDLNREQKYDKIILAGVQTGHLFLDPYTRISTMGIVLKNGALPALFGIPAGEFRDQVLSLNDLICSGIPEFREKLIEAPAVKEKFSIAEAFLTQQLKGRSFNLNPAVEAAVSQIDISCGRIPIADILDQTGYSSRWFSEVFRNSVGVNPKQYSRLCRFQNVINILRNEASLQSADIALRCGYFDQSHYIHDFKGLAGISPMEYYRHRGASANHLFI